MRTFILTVATTLISSVALAQETPVPEKPVPGWFRFDSDGLGLQLWAAAMPTLGPVDIATDVYVTSGGFGEFDIGPSFTTGGLTMIPMAGAGFDWNQKRMVNVIPQLFTFLDIGPIYFESWFQAFLNSPLAKGSNNDLYARDFLLVKLGKVLAVGPHAEITFALNNGRNMLASLPVGGHANVYHSSSDRIELFLGYETRRDARRVDTGTVNAAGQPIYTDRGLVGRFTYVHSW